MSLLGPRLLSGVGAPRAGRAPQAQSLVAGAQRTVKVKVAAQVQPVLPPPVVGSPFTPVEFDGMTVTRTWMAPGARVTTGAPPVRRTHSRPPAYGLPLGDRPPGG